MQFPLPEEGGRGGCQAGDISKFVTVLLILSGGVVLAGTIGVVIQVVSNPAGGWYKTLIRDVELEQLKAKAAETDGWSDDIIIFWKITKTKNWFWALFCITIWIVMGMIWGIFSTQRMSFLSSLYFAVTAISTAGNEPIKYLGPDTPEGCKIGLFRMDQGIYAFVGVYLFFGVPLYGWALSALAAGYSDVSCIAWKPWPQVLNPLLVCNRYISRCLFVTVISPAACL